MSAVIEIPPADTSLYQKARKLIDSGDIERADAILAEHLARNPEDAQALLFVAEILKKAKRCESA